MESYIHILHSISYIYGINIYITTCLSSNNILLLYICNILRRETYIYIHKSIYCRFGHVYLKYTKILPLYASILQQKKRKIAIQNDMKKIIKILYFALILFAITNIV